MKKILILLSLAIFLTAVLTWPFVLNIASYYTDQGDYPFTASLLVYNSDSLITGRIFNYKEYWQGYQFYPQPYSFAFANHSFAPSLIFAPIYWISGSLVFSANVYAMLTLILSFMISFYAINYFVKNSWASMVGAFIFTFNPPTMVRFPQHLDVLAKYFLPLVFLFAYKFLEKPSIKNSIGLFAFFTLNALSNNYYQIFSVVILPLVALPWIVVKVIKKRWEWLIILTKYSLLGLIFLPILLYFDLPYYQFSQKEGAVREIDSTAFFSARINDFFAATPDNLLYGGWVKNLESYREPKDDRGILNYEEHTLFLGLLPWVLVILGWRLFHQQKIVRSFFYLLLIIPLLLTFGPYLGGEAGGFKLPYYYLYQLAPILSGIRSPTRWEFILLLPFALITTFGVLQILKKWPKRGVAIITVIMIILILENITIKDFSTRSEVLSQLTTEKVNKLSFLEGKNTLHLPIYTTDDADEFGKNSAYLNFLSKTKELIFNGNSSYLPPDQLAYLSEFKNLDELDLKRLSLLGIDYIIIHRDLLNDPNLSFIREAIYEDENLLILSIATFKSSEKRCSLQELESQFGKGLNESSGEEFSVLILKNTKDCFLVSLGMDRYQQIPIKIKGLEKQAQIRLPLLVEPGQQVVLSESDKTLRIK